MPTSVSSRFLDRQALAALERMRFTTRHRIDGHYSGRHSSRQKGGSGEFVDYREYSPGEDLRRLDWKVLARTGKSYVRLFQDETNLLCTVALDVSESMTFAGEDPREGSGSKLEFAQHLATGFSHIISQGQDQIGLAVLADELQTAIPCGGTTSHVKFVQQTIEAVQPSPSLTLGAGLLELFQRMSTRGVLLLISDFLVDDLEACFSALRLFRHRRFEVVLLHLVHPEEEQLPEGRSYRFEGLEGEGRIDCSPQQIRDEYAAGFAKHLAAVRRYALAEGCDYRRVSTAQSYLHVLSSFLVERT